MLPPKKVVAVSNVAKSLAKAVAFADVIAMYKPDDSDLNEPQVPEPDFSECKKISDYVEVLAINWFMPRSCLFISKDTGKPCITIPDNNNKFRTYIIRSKDFESFLVMDLFEILGCSVSTATLAPRISLMSAYATWKGIQKSIFKRFGVNKKTGEFYYNLANRKAEFVKITKTGVCITLSNVIGYNPPFTINSAMREQVMPALHGNGKSLVELLRPYFKLKHDSQLTLLAIILVCWCIPDIPKPILLFTGKRGHGKSFACETIQLINDPANHYNFDMPKKLSDLYAILASQDCVLLDNISKLPEDISDKLATAVTGSSVGKRELYSDNTLHVESLKYSNIILAGIDNFVVKDDLMSRIVHIPLELKKSEKNRNSLEILKAQRAKDMPYILHEIFVTLSKALKFKSKVNEEKARNMKKIGRLNDFEVYGRCVSMALFEKQSVFVKEYRETLEREEQEILLTNTTILTTYEYLSNRPYNQKWPMIMRPVQLYEAVKKFGIEQGLLTGEFDTSFALSAAVFGKTVSAESTKNGVKYNSAMEKLGYRITTKPGTHRTIYVEKI